MQQLSQASIANFVFGHDFLYLQEKLGSTLRDLQVIAEACTGADTGSARQKKIVSALKGALSTTIGLLAIAKDEQLEASEIRHYVSEIIENGADGYESVAYAFALRDKGRKFQGLRELEDLLTSLETMLQRPRAEARTLIHQMLAPYESDRRSLVREMVALTDQVSMGDLEWARYRVRVTQIIRRIREKHLPTL